MKFICTVKHLPDGRWRAEAFKSSIGSIGVTGDDRERVLDKLRAEIRYRLKWVGQSVRYARVRIA
jgi:hypothetical protein